MLFSLKLKTSGRKISYGNLSIAVRYLIDDKNIGKSINNFEKIFNIHISNLQRKNFVSESGSEIRFAKPNGKPDEILLFKVKLNDSFSVDYFRNNLAGLLQSLQKEQLNELHIFIPNFKYFKNYFDAEEYYYQTFVEGVLLGNYTFGKYKSGNKKAKSLNISFYSADEKKLKTAIQKAQIIIGGVFFARDLQNEPANYITPNTLAIRVKKTLSTSGVKVTVFNEKEIKKRKMGGLFGVGMGSDNPPRFIVMEYNGKSKIKSKKSNPPARQESKTIALVGKGVTFDTGGISIKPAANMGEMKADMSGAAVVAGTVLAAAKAKLPIHLFGIIPTAENMVSGKSMRPGDILITSSGKSIEVDNTDAEGRLILADALNYASKLKPDLIIDLATLTGACVVALGEFVAGSFTKNESVSKKLFNAGLKTFDRIWPLPLWDDYNYLIKSDVADVKNIGGRWAGAITAAKFLENFVDKKTPWVHLDIAGPSMANSFNNYTRTYMTGFGVRLLMEFIQKY
jgi:leucyl aminopeptidase